MTFQNEQCVQDKNTKQKYKVISKKMQPVVTEFNSRQYFEANGKYPPPPEYEYELENAKTGEKLKANKPHSDLESCYFDKKIKLEDCVKKSRLGPGYIVKSISQEPPFKLTLEDKETKEESTEPVPIEDYYHCSFPFLKKFPFQKNSQSNNPDINTKQQPTGPAGGKRRTRKAKKSKKRVTKKAKKSAKRKSRKSRR